MQSQKMMVFELNQSPDQIGGKAKGLKFLKSNNFLVPNSIVIPCTVYEAWIENQNVLDSIKLQISRFIAPNKKYIVRSSASLEDSKEYSYAGQFLTISDLKGVEEITNAIITVWKGTKQAIEYSKKMDIMQKIEVAVIIQEQLLPEVSGVVFTRNPLNGVEEIIIESINGSSDKILQQGIDPNRWIYRWGRFTYSPDKPEIDEKIILEVARKSKEIEEKYGLPLDMEWLYAYDKIWWIQLREITTIDEVDYYSNKISSEQLPGLIKPLIWSINIPMICGSWKKLVEEIIGKTDLAPNNMARQFYYRAYYNMSELGKAFEKIGIPRDSLELMMEENGGKSLKIKPPILLFPKMMKFIIEKTFYEKRLEKQIEIDIKINKEYKIKSNITPDEAIYFIDKLFYYNSISSYYVIVSQMLYAVFYNMLKKRTEEKKIIIDDSYFQSEFDVNPLMNIKVLSEKIVNEKISLDTLNKSPEYLDFLDRFGHLSESGNDFSYPTWAELPEHVLKLIELHHTKIQESNSPSNINELEKWWLFKKTRILYRLREKVTFYYTKNYTLFRDYFVYLSNFLVNKKVLEDKDDIFFLKYEEIKDIIKNRDYKSKMKKINQIKEEMKKYQNVNPPTEIYGKEEPPIPKIEDTNCFKGIPASRGYFMGIVKHLKEIDFSKKIDSNNVVIIPYSDISWIPLISNAGAIISESGGLLSHAAVIAREYKIPAVLGVKNAFQIKEDSTVIVDGYTGDITCV